MEANGTVPPAPVEVRKCLIPTVQGRLEIRYLTSNGIYLGEVSLFAVNPEALQVILKDLLTMVSPIITTGVR